MKTEVKKLEFISKEQEPCYGGVSIICEYELATLFDGIKNTYTVKPQLRGFDAGSVYIDWYSSKVKAHNNNEATLTEEAIRDLLDEYTH